MPLFILYIVDPCFSFMPLFYFLRPYPNQTSFVTANSIPIHCHTNLHTHQTRNESGAHLVDPVRDACGNPGRSCVRCVFCRGSAMRACICAAAKESGVGKDGIRIECRAQVWEGATLARAKSEAPEVVCSAGNVDQRGSRASRRCVRVIGACVHVVFARLSFRADSGAPHCEGTPSPAALPDIASGDLIMRPESARVRRPARAALPCPS
ncbi:hypothetical protein B0H12DRAFT_1103262 [Mycena haematopus]|nr:hypothetical protein B0H12DRAFT_1103262 [Mycena haematopus]